MIELPGIRPVTIPDAEPIVATLVLPEVHVPPPPSVKVVVEPSHKEAVPEIDEGEAATVTITNELQPSPSV